MRRLCNQDGQADRSLQDLYRRSVGFQAAPGSPPELTLATYPVYLLRRYYRFYGLPAEAAVGMLIMLLIRDVVHPGE